MAVKVQGGKLRTFGDVQNDPGYKTAVNAVNGAFKELGIAKDAIKRAVARASSARAELKRADVSDKKLQSLLRASEAVEMAWLDFSQTPHSADFK